MPSLPVLQDAVTVHLSLNVFDLPRSVEFYRAYFGVAPAKHHADYAKFELDDPPVIFSLVPHGPGLGGSPSHLGFRVADEATLDRFRKRLETAGICTQVQEGAACGHAKQDKCWSKDPDGNFWEIYHDDEDIDPIVFRKSVKGTQARIVAAPTPGGPIEWEHYVSQPFPERIPQEDATVDEVRLTGSFNGNLTQDQLRHLLDETRRVLKPGGKLVTHGLMADRPFPGAQPKLPGLAAMVSRMPVHIEPMEMFASAGFTGVQIVKFTEKPWFKHDGVELREVKIIAWKPTTALEAETRRVLYKGPFARATADGGYAFPRGRRVSVPLIVFNQLRLGPTSESFLFLEGSP